MKSIDDIFEKYNTNISKVSKDCNIAYRSLSHYRENDRSLLNMKLKSMYKIASFLNIGMTALYLDFVEVENNKRED